MIRSGAALFTEVNVALVATTLGRADVARWRVARFRALAWVGKSVGTYVGCS